MQVVDTPGVLGQRSRKNAAESEALVAVGSAAHVILFVLDQTERCGYFLADQEALLERWKREYPSTPIIEVETKVELGPPLSGRLQVSATTGTGLKELRKRLEAAVVAARPAVDESPAKDVSRDETG